MVSKLEEALRTLEAANLGVQPFSDLESRNSVAGRVKPAKRALRLIAGEEDPQVTLRKTHRLDIFTPSVFRGTGVLGKSLKQRIIVF